MPNLGLQAMGLHPVLYAGAINCLTEFINCTLGTLESLNVERTAVGNAASAAEHKRCAKFCGHVIRSCTKSLHRDSIALNSYDSVTSTIGFIGLQAISDSMCIGSQIDGCTWGVQGQHLNDVDLAYNGFGPSGSKNLALRFIRNPHL